MIFISQIVQNIKNRKKYKPIEIKYIQENVMYTTYKTLHEKFILSCNMIEFEQ